MSYVIWSLVALVALLVVVNIAWGVASRFWTLPCPATLSWMLDGSLADRLSGTETTLEQLQRTPGQTVLEVGPGPGRLLVPASFRVLPGGRAIGVDIQFKMIEKLKQKAAAAGVANLTTLVGSATELKLPDASVDVAYMCTVL